jgi:hypothetical protein
LSHIKDCHDDVEGVGEDIHGDKGLEYPFEYVECVEVRRDKSRCFSNQILKSRGKLIISTFSTGCLLR